MELSFKIGFGIFGLIGVLFLVLAAQQVISTNEFLDNSISVKGTVIEMIAHTSKSRENRGEITYHPRIEFMTIEQNVIIFNESLGSNPPSFKTGDTVDVLYNPNNPTDARVNSPTSLWFTTIILSIIGGVCFILGIISAKEIFSDFKRARRLKTNGTTISTTIKKVGIDDSIRVNGRNIFRIWSQWEDPLTKKSYDYESDGINFDPQPYITNQTVTVVIDKSDHSIYKMDISFLPKKK